MSGDGTQSWLLPAALFLVVSLACAQNLQCSDNEEACVQALRDTLTRTDLWFGDPYSSACPDGTEEKSFACRNPDRRHKTIISRVLQEPNFYVANLTHLLHVRFYVPAGSYRACGHRFDVPAAYMSQDLQVSEEGGLDSWSMQTRPAIRWDPQPGAVYSLAAYNLDLVQLAGLWINIQGGDSALGTELSPYSGPLAALNRTSFHAFVLFRQSVFISDSQVDLVRENINYGRRQAMFTIKDLQPFLGQVLKPVGAGLISTGADPYGIERHKTLSLHNNCPWLIARMRPMLRKVLEVHNLTALGADASNLEVEVEVRYTSEAVTFTSCCKAVSSRAMTLQVDPLSQKPVSPVYLRSPPFVKLFAVNMQDTIFFLDKLYSLLFLDVTMAITTHGQRQTSLLWHVSDIPGQHVTAGLTNKEYTVPLPPPDRSSNSLYTFFVFRQSDTFGNYTVDKYCSTSSTRDSDCDFNLYKFVLENKMQLSGVNWLWSKPDLYSRMRLYETDVQNMDTACNGVSGYSQPCPKKCAPQVAPTTTATATAQTTAKPGGGTSRMSVNGGLAHIVPILIVAFFSVLDKS